MSNQNYNITPYQQKYLAWQLSRKRNSSDDEKLTSVLSEAKVDLNPHQVEAALFAFRSPLSMGAILADEVGLGKTIEAALVISQKWAERKKHILIIAPATLRKQWSNELNDKFYLPSMILERKNFNKILNDTYKNPFDSSDNIIICSYPFARKNITHISKVNWDLIVLDEAHSLRNVYKSNNKTGKALKLGLQPFKKILLTATPLQNDIKELYGLISIIDNNYFGDLSSFAAQYNKVALRDENTYIELRKRILPIVHRTLRSQVQAYVRYTNRIPLVQEYFPSDDEIELASRIKDYLARPNSYGLPKSQRNLISLILFKLLASSSFAIAGTLKTIIQRLENLISRSESINEGITNDDFDEFDEYQEEWLDEDAEDTETETDFTSLTPSQIEEVKDEVSELTQIHELALSISSNSKGECLVKALRLGFEHMSKMSAPKKALIFTESRRTQSYLFDLLSNNGYEGKIVLFNGTNTDANSSKIYNDWLNENRDTSKITGSKSADKRQALVDYFRNSAEIMIATEAASEGINLQFCSLIVNFDLPWNPQRVEQRIGRCHRYGQKYDVVVVNFLNKSNRADQRVYELLDQKFNLFKGVFGVSDEVLGTIGNGVDFEKRILAIYQQCRSTEDIDAAFDALQQDMKDSIEDNLQQTRNSLFENFDEEVIEKLKLREDTDNQRLSQYNKFLWLLTCSILKESITIFQNGKYEFNLMQSPLRSVPVGKYRLSKDDTNCYNYRISHPLAKFIINKAINAPTPIAEVQFDYDANDTIISLVSQNRGKSGLLAFRVMRYSSLKETEEHIILSAIDEMGNEMDDSFAQRLLTIPARVLTTSPQISANNLHIITNNIDTKITALTDSLEVRNADIVSAEVLKIENWAEDNRNSLQQKLSDLDKAIEEKNTEFIKQRNIRKKLAIQKEKDALNEKRDNAWREFDTKKEELKRQKNEIISQLYELADGKIQAVDNFIIKWHIA